LNGYWNILDKTPGLVAVTRGATTLSITTLGIMTLGITTQHHQRHPLQHNIMPSAESQCAIFKKSSVFSRVVISIIFILFFLLSFIQKNFLIKL